MKRSCKLACVVVMLVVIASLSIAAEQWFLIGLLPKPTQMNASVYYNGYIYCVAGYNMVDYTATYDVYYGKLNSQGRIDGGWTATTPLPNNQSYVEDAAFAYNDRLYVVSGWDYESSVYVPNVHYADINPDGSLGEWTAAALPTDHGTDCLAAVQANGYIYVISGENAATGSDEISDIIDYAPINPDGSLGTWSEASLPLPLWFMEAEVVGDYLVVFSGLSEWSADSAQTAVYTAPLNPSDGSIGSWTTQANSLPEAFYGAGSCVHNNTIYTMGGRTSEGEERSGVLWAEVDTSTGTVGEWQTDTLPDPFPTTIYYNNISASDEGWLYVVGGRETNDPYVVLDTTYGYLPAPLSAQNWTVYY